MSSTAPRTQRPATEAPGSPGPSDEAAAGSAAKRGNKARWAMRAFGLLVVVALVVTGFVGLAGKLQARGAQSIPTQEVRNGNLLVTITQEGNVESAGNLSIKCEVAGGSTILQIVDDGKEVEKGELLVELDSSRLDEQVSQQTIVTETARAAMIQARNDYEVAKLAIREYLEGTYKKQHQDLESQVTVAMENLRSAENVLQFGRRMFRKGYAASLQLEAQQFAVQRAELELESAQTAMKVLEEFTKEKTVGDLQSQVGTGEAKRNAQKALLELEESRLERLTSQEAKCKIFAPHSGMAIYANEFSRGRGGSSEQTVQIELGARVREQQDILRMPDLSQMQVRIAVHESRIDRLQSALAGGEPPKAIIRVQGQEYKGTVASIANQPRRPHFFSGNVKEYDTLVKIDGEPRELKPGMTADVEIVLARLKNVLTVPVDAVTEQRGKFYCWVKEGEVPEKRLLQLGLTNDKSIEVKEGIAEGEHVVLNPRDVIDEARLMQDEDEPIDVIKRFGGSDDALVKADTVHRGEEP